MINVVIWPHRLSVRTSGFHPGKRSSTLLGVTKVKSSTLKVGLFTLVVLEENRTPIEVSEANGEFRYSRTRAGTRSEHAARIYARRRYTLLGVTN